MKTIDGTGLYHDAIRRIQQLERYNAELAAQIDRMTPVVDAALHWYSGKPGWSMQLAGAVSAYEQQMAALAKGAGG